MQHSSKKGVVKQSRVQGNSVLLRSMQSSSLGCSYLNRLQRSSVGSALACFKAGQGSIPFLVSHPMEVFLAEQTSDEENHEETLAAGMPGKRLVRHRHF
jgi:hypothetical protein